MQRHDRTLSGLLGGKRLGGGGLGEATLEQQPDPLGPALSGGSEAVLTRGFSTPPPAQKEVCSSGRCLWHCFTREERGGCPGTLAT